MSGNTLRDALSEAMSAQEAETQTVDTVDSTPVETLEAAPTETAQQTADRLRDEAGRFKSKEAPAPAPVVDPLAPPVVERKPPTSWKKDYWEAYSKLDPKLADYISQREQQFASGVSTYKQEAERAKELFDAVAPFQADLQQHGLSTKDWIRQLGGAHQMLVKGSPQQKIEMFQRLAQEYGVPLQNVQTGQVDPLMQYLSPLQEQVRQLQGQLTGWQQEKQNQEQQTIQSEIDSFAAQNEHFEVVKETMAGLLQAGLAQDLKSAYDKAVRMNDETWAAEQQRQTGDAEKQRREAEATRVARARANAVSTKTATPSGVMASGGKKDVRSLLEASVEQVLGGARV